MRSIELSTAFKRDYKRAKASPRYAQDVRSLFESVALLLANDEPLPDSYRDHALIGDWKGYRECHLKPDLLLIYKTEEPDILKIARLGSHSELFSR
ncbi:MULTISPECIES: type II toxin-antitoxin system YafQ family toxin [unclassified Desulfovibrio]|uniref:type II toxin-antitoxin system RelE/ParE family toxin n=1 Tax=unclassified Desulfovibrio TaxID=2593640 RepID=UPI0013EA8595|nr:MULTISPECIES: type II toxin-antitoxin system YafQ family toxin [unclassified Desulfovibrio]